jgi:hypothetical protein
MMLCVLVSTVALAKSDRPEPVARMAASSSSIQWQPVVANEKIVLTVIAPDGTVFQKEFAGGTPSFRLQDLAGKPMDGPYTYELRAIPRISDDVKRQLAAARAADDDAAVERIQRAAGIGQAVVQSGNLLVTNGSFVNSDAEEPTPSVVRLPKVTSNATTSATAAIPRKIETNSQVIATDLIVQGSACVGLDCVSTESFGFDTIRMKENNTRIKFADTSTAAGFPNNNWQLTANDSASGGANKFSIDDITGSKTPFTVTAGAPTNSFFMASNGKVGFRTSAPVLDLHITTGDTPAIRQEQTNASGFTAQTWDIGANEANWFVRDVTGGSRLPLRIRPGAPTSSVDISASGNVGINTASPSQGRMVVFDSTQLASRVVLSGQEYFQASNTSTDGMALLLGVNRSGDKQIWFADSSQIATQGSTNKVIRIAPNQADISARTTDAGTANLTLQNSGGFLAIGGSFTPTNPIQHNNGAFLSAGGVWTNSSSRALKQDICDLPADEAVKTLKNLTPVTYAYKADPKEHHVGFIAEDVPDLVATTSRTGVSPMDVVAVLTKVVQDQQTTIDELKARLAKLEQHQQ